MITKYEPPSRVKKRLEGILGVLHDLLNGIEGKPFTWNGGAYPAYCKKAKELGFEIITLINAEKLGLELRPKSKPIGYGSGTGKVLPLYLLNTHFNEIYQ